MVSVKEWRLPAAAKFLLHAAPKVEKNLAFQTKQDTDKIVCQNIIEGTSRPVYPLCYRYIKALKYG